MSIYPESVIADVNARLDIQKLLQLINYRVEKLQDSGETIRGFCPIHGESVFRTLIIDKGPRTFRCMYGLCQGAAGGNLIELFALTRKLSLDEAMPLLVREMGIDIVLPSDPAQVERTLEIAQNYLEQEGLEEAEKTFGQVLEMQPSCRAAHEGLLAIYERAQNLEGQARCQSALARLSFEAGQFEEALERARAATDLGACDKATHQVLTESLLALGDKEDALWELMAMADQCESQGDFEGAIEAYIKVEELELDIVDIQSHLIQAYMHAGQRARAIEHLVVQAERAAQQALFAKAIELYAAVIELEPERLDLRSRLAEVAALEENNPKAADKVFEQVEHFVSIEDYARAARALEKLLTSRPREERALMRLVEVYRAQGLDAQRWDVQVRLAGVHFEAGKVTEALGALQQVIEEEPGQLAALQAMAEFEGKKGNTSAANAALRRLARALFDRQEYGRAVEIYDRLLEADPGQLDICERRAYTLEGWSQSDNPNARELASRAFEQLGEQYEGATAGRRAIEFFERALDLGLPRPGLLLKLARACFRSRLLDKARENVMRACDLLAAAGQVSQAVHEADQFGELMPEDTELARYLAELYVRSGDIATGLERFRQLGEMLVLLDKENEAEEVLERALTLEPNNAGLLEDLCALYKGNKSNALYLQTLLRLAGLYEEQGAWAKAVESLEKLFSASPNEVATAAKLVQLSERLGNAEQARHWRLALAGVYHEAGDYEREGRVLRDVLALQPEDEQALSLLSECEFANGDPASACLVARRLAGCLQRAGQEEMARAALAAVLEKAPENVETNRELFESLLRAGLVEQALEQGRRLVEVLVGCEQIAEAAAAYEQIVECKPEDLSLRLEQVGFLRRIGRPVDACSRQFELARLYEKAEDFDKAEQLLRELLAEDPENLRIHDDLIRLYERLGLREKVEDQLRQLAEVHRRRGEFDLAIRRLEQILQVAPDSLEVRELIAQVHRDQGDVHSAVRDLHELSDMLRKKGAEAEALEAERQAAELDPSNSSVRRRFIQTLVRNDKHVDAAEELEQLASIQMRNEEYAEAQATLDQLVEYAPERLSTRRIRAELYVKLGDQECALQEYRAISDTLVNSTASAMAQRQTLSELLPQSQLQLVKEYDFEHFVVGTTNNFAYATALAVARAPARAYNPLFVYSDVGLGKTHLANAIANYVLAHDPKARVIYTNFEDFTGELVHAIQTNTVNQFRTRYKTLDLLIVDDVQFLAGKERAQEEFFHIFNALFQAKRQIVVTSDRPPKDIAHLENRLLSRFGAGVIVDIAPPDVETRTAILCREIEQENLGVDPAIAGLIAESIHTNVRELKGALNQIVAMRDFQGLELTEENVRKALEAFFVRN